jgi:hypothetical protein
MKTPRYRIRSDGTIRGTKVIDLKTNEELLFVTDISWFASVEGGIQAVITLETSAELETNLPEGVVSLAERRIQAMEG